MFWCVVRGRTIALGALGLILCFVFGTFLGWLHTPKTMIATSTPQAAPPPLGAAINTILRLRAVALLNNQAETLPRLYDLSAATGRWALERDKRRIKYINAWAEKRGLKMVEASAESRIVRTEDKGGSIWVYAIQTAGFGYVYPDDPDAKVQRFGVGTRHVMELVLRDNDWVLKRDWYTDPLDEDTLIPEVTPAIIGSPVHVIPTLAPQIVARRREYQRDAAIQYANTYCGAAWGCGNEGRYNQDYKDYTGLGGDCTNFASQVLGDPQAGALPGDGTWRYSGKGWQGAGSTAWVKADAFARYLTYSGLAQRLARGTYRQVVELASKLEPGDLIAYEEKGRVVHFAVITARDIKGVPLVNTHTADRYQVPWDLGWDAKTIYWLFHIR